MEEQWKMAKNYSNYSCSNLGRIKNNNTGRILNPKVDNTGYITLVLENDQGKKIHRGIHQFIAETWIENPENKPTVNHKNKNRLDNRVENLEWATHSEQNKHKSDGQKKEIASNIGIWKCDKETGEKIKYYRTTTDAEKELGIKSACGNIVRCAKGKIKHVYGFKWQYDDSKLIDIEKDSLEGEEWREIENGYYISNLGRVRHENRLLEITIKDGYKICRVNGKQHRVHRLVALKFIPNDNSEENKVVNHLNGEKIENSQGNLEWTTHKKNAQHAIDNGLKKSIKKIVNYDKDYNILGVYNTATDASKKLDIHCGNLLQCCKGKANIYDKNGNQLFFKFLEPEDDLTDKKISQKNLKFKEKKVRDYNGVRKINVYDKENKLLETCDTLMETAKKYEMNRNTIVKHCNGEVRYSACKYIFKFAE